MHQGRKQATLAARIRVDMVPGDATSPREAGDSPMDVAIPSKPLMLSSITGVLFPGMIPSINCKIGEVRLRTSVRVVSDIKQSTNIHWKTPRVVSESEDVTADLAG